LGLLSSFQGANCICLTSIASPYCCVALLRSIFYIVSPLLGNLFFGCPAIRFRLCFLARPGVPGFGEGGSFYIRCLKFVKVFLLPFRVTPGGPVGRLTLHPSPIYRVWRVPYGPR
jgi:hypothetical protein